MATGRALVDGIAVGRAFVHAPPPPSAPPSTDARRERDRIRHACTRVCHELEELVRSLPDGEAELFVPELAIVQELGPLLEEHVGRGHSAERAVLATTPAHVADLILDARARLLDALGGTERAQLATRLRDGDTGPRILVTNALTPSMVAMLPPAVHGIVAMHEGGDAAEPSGAGAFGGGSHAAILARGRGIPLLHVTRKAVPARAAHVRDGEPVILDTLCEPGQVLVSPSAEALERAHALHAARMRCAVDREARAAAPLRHLAVRVCVNVGSASDPISPAADGVGLVRTELLFAGRPLPPSEAEQVATLSQIVRRARSCGERWPTTIRLYDAGGDKPIAWLPSHIGGRERRDADAVRGTRLLFEHPSVLTAQLRAIERVTALGDVRVLLPLVESADEVRTVRAMLRAELRVGAMIETRNAVAHAHDIVDAADFICIGTNDLAASLRNEPRGTTAMRMDRALAACVAHVVRAAHQKRLLVCVCGELASDPDAARILIGLGVDALSVAPSRLTALKLALQDETKESCRMRAEAPY
jgi:phosphocarrier protein FPr